MRIHTPVLLADSGLGGIGLQVGRNLTLRPGFRVFARFDESIRGWRGAMQSAFSDHFEDEHTLTSLFISGSVVAAQLPEVGCCSVFSPSM